MSLVREVCSGEARETGRLQFGICSWSGLWFCLIRCVDGARSSGSGARRGGVACAGRHAGCGGALLGVVLACRLRLGRGSCQDGAPLARARGSRFAWKRMRGRDTCGKASDCAWVARNRLVSGVRGCLPANVSRETFVPTSHHVATIVSRETLRFRASQSCPTPEPRNPGTPPSALCARSEGGCSPRLG